jgi:gamma-glutamyltranspeptidase/glutathione hydrolase
MRSALVLAAAGALLLVTEPAAQAPGDRPAGNPRGTRSAAVARNGMIATSQALASGAGLKVLQDGGNAIDAAITAAAVLAVVEPTMNGIGGDLFAIVYDAKTKRLHALDASGRSAHTATPEEFARRGHEQMPGSGVLTVDVPGVVEGWSQLLQRFGTISMTKALQPAIRYARDGFPVQEILAEEWNDAAKKLSQDAAAAATFLPGGRAPRAGEIFQNPRLAASLELIARNGRDAFYRGPIARAIVADMRARNGLLDERDFTTHTADWVETLSTSYRGYDVHEMPPSTQGFVALEMLNILEGFDVKAMGHNTADYLHHVTEAKKIAFADRAAYLADRRFVPADAMKVLLSKEYAAARRKEIDPRKTGAYKATALGGSSTAQVEFTGADHGDTIYMTAADGQGNVISLIQSLFASFGSGVVAGETGIALHNRGSGFTLAGGLRHEHPGGRRRGAHAARWRRVDARERNRRRHPPGARSARPPAARRAWLDGGLSGHPDRSADRRADGRLRSAEGRTRDRVVRTDQSPVCRLPSPVSRLPSPAGSWHASHADDDFVRNASRPAAVARPDANEVQARRRDRADRCRRTQRQDEDVREPRC